jgi:DNA replication initiation complex subunit (GINS family)
MEEETKDEVTITYETLFELLRREKEKSELQKLDSTFFNNVLRYLKDKKAIITQQQVDTSSIEDRAKIGEQLVNVKKIIREFYDRREKKIVAMAIDKSKNKSSIVDNSIFLKQEKELFESIVKILSLSRENVLFNIIELREPLSLGGVDLGNSVQDSPTPVVKVQKKDTKLVRFLNAVPKFVGKELEEYGPFEEEDIASLPVEIATVLINKQRVEEISED